ncbi:hypothetical protein QQP08_019481 [Theobroma cacao]|uniref:Membrane lipoprotein-like protein n=1 Tax=Theobroma cacao TaxID=3641 RepID=A0A061GG22_THECC|nr:Membrane lipoprotein-like protein [Theobroma cacao]WRX26994.1 hypothetical protein QQP08_019481 [Theobroma cacao]
MVSPKLQAMGFLFLSIVLFAQLNRIGAQSTNNCEIVKGTTCFVVSECIKPCESIGHTPTSALCIPSPIAGEGLTCCCSTL